MVAREEIIGTWEITACESRSLDGQVSAHPVGDNAVGYIIYNQDGYMALEMMARKRTPFTEQDPFDATDTDQAEAYRSYLSYVGTFEVIGDRVIHDVKLSSYPNFIGQTIERYVRLEGGVLYQTTEPFFMHGKTQSIHLVLNRVEAKICV
ncbi:MAG: lipocalin-like domain-containing protein [Chlamydiia bacterium]|nr:lipocalin-like domain-containing protein [Chlamydiia bacterium]